MTEQKQNFDPSHLEQMGLFRVGKHTDTEIVATSAEGKTVNLKVQWVHVSNGTIFVPDRGQPNSLAQLFPSKHNNGAMFRNRT